MSVFRLWRRVVAFDVGGFPTRDVQRHFPFLAGLVREWEADDLQDFVNEASEVNAGRERRGRKRLPWLDYAIHLASFRGVHP